ncbi:MAG: ribonuclease P protein component [Bacteroidia bacterium]
MLSLGKNKRLKSKKDIELLLTTGKKLKEGAVVMIYESSKDEQTKMAVSVQKKSFKKAVDRNRIKRLMREAFRLNQELFGSKNQFHIFFIYVGKEIETFDYYNQKIKQLLIRLSNNTTHDEQ